MNSYYKFSTQVPVSKTEYIFNFLQYLLTPTNQQVKSAAQHCTNILAIITMVKCSLILFCMFYLNDTGALNLTRRTNPLLLLLLAQSQ